MCHENTAEHFLEHLERVRHTAVTAERCQPEEISVRQELEERTGIVTSDRLDALLACVHKLSRSQAQALIRQEKVFVNGQTAVNPSRPCQAGDIVSARGYGRFVYLADYGETGKGRLKIRYQIYRN